MYTKKITKMIVKVLESLFLLMCLNGVQISADKKKYIYE